jgi:hypothetical protein
MGKKLKEKDGEKKVSKKEIEGQVGQNNLKSMFSASASRVVAE